ncbi:MAG: hypothetical protein EBU66_05165 [Bacteroidetes bacterium]|nr:hypothetical protein [bacterium]NBP64052.1 hypothetical protein [Bacteroidota bacterium]
MKDHNGISLLFPDHINGTLSLEERKMVDEALQSSPELQAEYDSMHRVFQLLDRDEILADMEMQAHSIGLNSFVRVSSKRPILQPVRLMIGASTAIAACMLIWIGITHTSKQENSNATLQTSQYEITPVLLSDEIHGLTMTPDDLEDIMLEEVLALYVRDIESDGDAPLNPVLEEEITKFLLKDSKDEESL